MMKRFSSLLILIFAISFGQGNWIFAAEPMPSESQMAPTAVVSLTGQLTAVEGELFVIKDETGREFQIQVDKFTSMIGNPRPGAWIEAKVSVDTGHAEVIKVLERS